MSGDRCVLWISRGQRPDAELLGALDRKGLHVEVCADPFETLARVCIASRVGAERGAVRASVMLLCDPDRLDRAGEVVRLSDRYAPRARVWVFDSAARRLRGATKEETDRWSGTEVTYGSAMHHPGRGPTVTEGARLRPERDPRHASRAARFTGPPSLRLSGNGSLPVGPDDPGDPKPDKTRSGEVQAASGPEAAPAGLLSDEELAMLLSTDDPARDD